MLTSLAILFALAYPACLMAAAMTDLVGMTIPNRLTIGMALAFIPAAFCQSMGLETWGVHLGLGLAGLIIGMVLFALRLMGGGDAKLIAATALWLGWDGIPAFLIYTALAGGVLTLLLLGARQVLVVATPKMPPWLAQHMAPKGDIPYGIAICAGGLAAIWHSQFLNLIRP